MSEYAKQIRWKHHDGRSSALTHMDSTLLNKGGIEGYIVRTRFLERPKHRMLIKRFEIPNNNNPEAAKRISLDRARRSVVRYGELKALGIKVPTTYRLHEHEPEVLMTDLSQNGRHRVLSINNEPNNDQPVGDYLLTVEQIESIFAQLHTMAHQAAQGGYYLAGDSYLFVSPQGKSEQVDVVVTDYGGCLKYPVTEDDEEKIEKIEYDSLRVARKALSELLKRHTTMTKEQIDTTLDRYRFPRTEQTIWD